MRTCMTVVLVIAMGCSAFAQDLDSRSPWDYYWHETLGASVGLVVGGALADVLIKVRPGIEYSLIPHIVFVGGAVAGADLVGRLYGVKGDYRFAAVATVGSGLIVTGLYAFYFINCSSQFIPVEVCDFIANQLYLPVAAVTVGAIAMGTAWGYLQGAEFITQNPFNSSLEVNLFSLTF